MKGIRKIRFIKPITIGISVGVVLVVVGTVGALNGWFGGGAKVPEDTMTRGLVGYWSFDEGSGSTAYDSTENNNDGTLLPLPLLPTSFSCGDSVNFTYKGSSVTYNSTSSQGECWLDRNLGASQVATAYNDANAYGDLFQWGRLDDQHQTRTSGTQTGLSSSDNPGHSNFIYGMGSPYDWRSPQNDNLWQGVSGINNPCPSGWRLPTETELDTERLSWSSNDSAGAYASPLKLTVAGLRLYVNASVLEAGNEGYYWGSTVDGVSSRHLKFTAGNTFMQTSYRANGFSVRCLKDYPTAPPSWTTGKHGTALEFDGVDDYVSVPAFSILDNSSFSVEFWFKTYWMGRTSGLFHKGSPFDTRNAVHILIHTSNNLRFGFYNDDLDVTLPSDWENKWLHVVAGFDKATLQQKVYIDGVLSGTRTAGGVITGTDDDALELGRLYYRNDETTDGLIDEVRIYNRALSKEEVRYHYNRGGPVAHWKFDEGNGTTTYDGTENGNDGTLGDGTCDAGSGTCPVWTTGKYGTGLLFDGENDYVEIPDDSSLDITDAITIEAWVKMDSYPDIVVGTDRYYGIVGKRSGTTYNYELLIGGTSNENDELIFSFYNSGYHSHFTSNVNLQLNIWYHLVMTFDASTDVVKIYVNGVEKLSESEISTMLGDTNSVKIGYADYTSEYFDGIIDDARVYNYARSAEEVRLDYNAGFGVRFGGSPAEDMTRGLVGYWSFDEGSGVLNFDESGYGNHGMINDGGSGNPIAYWTFDEGTGQTAYDYIGTSTNNGTLGSTTSADAGDPVWTSNGRIGGALIFDGVGNHVNAGNDSSLNFGTGDFSVEAWVKVAGTSPTLRRIVSKQTSAFWLFRVSGANSILSWTISDSANQITKTGSSLALDIWYHVVLVKSGTTGTAYLNGVLDSTDTNVSLGDVNTSAADLYIGTFNEISESFDGLIDDVRIYNYARAVDDIMEDYLETYKNKYSEGAPSPSVSSGRQGTSLSFDGVDDYVDLGDKDVFEPRAGSFSIETWMYPITVDGKRIIWKDAGTSPPTTGWFIWENNAQTYFGDGVTTTVANGPSGMALNAWHHVVAVRDKAAGNVVVYIDGVSGTAVNDNTNDVYNTVSLSIGGRPGVGTEMFNGSIDEMRIYNRALSAEEVRYHYNRGGPVAHWKFDEGNGTSTKDATWNNNDGTLGVGTCSPGSGTCPTWTTGKYGTGLLFDGENDYVNIPIILSSQEMTGCAWIKVTSANEKKGILNGMNYNFHMWVNADGTFNFGAWTTYTNEEYTSAASYPFGVWRYVCTVNRGADSTKLYVDGVFDKQVSLIGTLRDITFFDVGRHSGNALNYFNGLIDNIRIYNYVRTAEEIRLDYNQGLAGRFAPTDAGCDKDPAGCMNYGLMGYWNMDEGDGGFVYDQSDYQNTGYVRPEGKALEFDGNNDYVDVGTDESLNFGAGSFTVEAWMFYTTQAIDNAIFESTDSTGRRRISLRSNAFSREDNTGTMVEVYPNGSVTANTWHHLVGTYDGTDIKIYLDGESKQSTGDSGTLDPATDNWIGARPPGIIWDMDGLIDDVRIYNRALSATEVAEHYEGIFSTESGSVGYWSFDEGYGTTAYDQSRKGNHGTSYGPTWKNNAPRWTQGAPAVNGGWQGTALEFDGVDDWVEVSTSTNNGLDDITDAITVEVWLKLRSATRNGGVISKQDSVNSFILDYDSVYDTDCTGNGLQMIITNTWIEFCGENMVANLWYHAAVTWDGQVMRTYLDGVGTNQKAKTGSMSSGDADLLIGIYDLLGVAVPFNGSIDEVRIYNRALSVEEIRYHYNRGAPTAHWAFDEGSGTTTYDGTNNNNDGALGGGTTANVPTWVSGKYGSALLFDGVDDYVDTAPVVNLATTFSLEFWFNSAIETPNRPFGNFNSYGSTNIIIESRTDYALGGFRFRYGGTGVGSVIETPYVNDQKWHQVVWIHNAWNGSYHEYSIFTDGVLTGTAKWSGEKTANNILRIGNTSNSYNGTIDDVRIYNYARTAEQILIDYNGGFSTYFR